jgi:hypothetical protein
MNIAILAKIAAATTVICDILIVIQAVITAWPDDKTLQIAELIGGIVLNVGTLLFCKYKR